MHPAVARLYLRQQITCY